MTKKSKTILNAALIGIPILMVFFIAFSNSELANAWEALFTLDWRWLLACLGGFLGYVFFDGLGIFAFLQGQGYRLCLGSALHLSFMGFYYANITPGSSGGQPMQVYLMSQRKIPVGVSSSALTVKLFTTQLATVLITAVLWLCNRDFCRTQLGSMNMIIIIGWVINFSVVPLILLITFHRPLMERFARWLIRLLTKLRWLRHPDETTERVMRVLDNYHSSMKLLQRKPSQILLQVVIGLCEMLCLTSITVFVYKAFGLSGTPNRELLTVAFMLFVSASYTPLPGASGAQEGGFLLFYRGIFTGGTISVALLVWRFFTYYLFLLLGVVDTLITSIRRRRHPVQEISAPKPTEETV